MTDSKLDRIDLRILSQLQKRGRDQRRAGRCGRAVAQSLPDPREAAREGRLHRRLRRAHPARETRRRAGRVHRGHAGRPSTRGFRPLRRGDPQRRRDRRMPPRERRLRLSAEVHHAQREPLPDDRRRAARAEHRHREVFQLRDHQIAVRQTALPARIAVRRTSLHARAREYGSVAVRTGRRAPPPSSPNRFIQDLSCRLRCPEPNSFAPPT